MSFAADSALVWPIPPNWKSPVRETLTWLTEVSTASATGVSQHRQLRLAPRRSFAFDVLAKGQSRRLADLLLDDALAKVWLMPVWPDVQVLTAPVAAGATNVACRTAGFDFVDGGKALLWSALNTWSVVNVDKVDASALTLSSGVDRDYPVGTRLYPLRSALVTENPEETLLTDALGRRTLTVNINEPCDWPAAWSPELPASNPNAWLPIYRDRPVLEWRPAEGESPKSTPARAIILLDNDTGIPFPVDLAGIARRTRQFSYILHGREEQSRFRSILHMLRGRMVPAWVPSFVADLAVVADIAADDTDIAVEWTGYTLYGRQQPQCCDIRIKAAGQVYYRRITASVDAGDHEILTLDSALGVAVPVRAIRQVSFMRLATLASDTVEIAHHTSANGIATCSLAFTSVVDTDWSVALELPKP